MQLEEVRYKQVWRTSINDYLAETIKGKIKAKGQFIYEKVLDGSNEFLIVAIAFKNYYLDSISIKDSIYKHTNIFDFCAAKKIDKSYQVFHNNQKVQQLNRFYCSKKGAYLYKSKPVEKAKKGKVVMEHIFSESGVQILNHIPKEFPDDVDYKFYENKVRTLIESFNTNQLKLF